MELSPDKKVSLSQYNKSRFKSLLADMSIFSVPLCPSIGGYLWEKNYITCDFIFIKHNN